MAEQSTSLLLTLVWPLLSTVFPALSALGLASRLLALARTVLLAATFGAVEVGLGLALAAALHARYVRVRNELRHARAMLADLAVLQAQNATDR